MRKQRKEEEKEVAGVLCTESIVNIGIQAWMYNGEAVRRKKGGK